MLKSSYFNIEQAPCLIFRPGIYPMLKDRQLHDTDAHLDFLNALHYLGPLPWAAVLTGYRVIEREKEPATPSASEWIVRCPVPFWRDKHLILPVSFPPWVIPLLLRQLLLPLSCLAYIFFLIDVGCKVQEKEEACHPNVFVCTRWEGTVLIDALFIYHRLVTGIWGLGEAILISLQITLHDCS